MESGSRSDSDELLHRIREFVCELLYAISEGNLPAVNMATFQIREDRPGEMVAVEKRSTIFEESDKPEHLAVSSKGGACRLLAMLRVLQIVQQLLQQNRHATKRDVYYSDPAILKGRVNQALNDICIHFQCSRSSLHVVAVSKGLIMGPLSYQDAGRIIKCSKHNCNYAATLQLLAVAFTARAPDICSGADYILLVEKETVFQRLVNDKFCGKNRCILLTGKGYPDVATRSFLRRLTDELHLPVYALMDGDPYGLDILSVYRFGSLTMAYDAEVLAVPEIFWLGVHLSDCLDFHIPEECLLPLTERDKRKADALLSRSYLKHLAPGWWTKLAEFRSQAVKLEIEAVSAASFSLLADHYIQSKIQGKGYV